MMYLSTVGSDGFPYTRIMSNLRNKKEHPGLVKIFEQHKDDFLIFMVTSSSSDKMHQIRANPKVSVYLAAYSDTPSEFQCLMLGGEIEIITNQELKNRIWQKGWTMYYPNGPEGPEYGVIKLVPSIAKGRGKNGPFEIKL